MFQIGGPCAHGVRVEELEQGVHGEERRRLTPAGERGVARPSVVLGPLDEPARTGFQAT
jgi:hypothetical protein